MVWNFTIFWVILNVSFAMAADLTVVTFNTESDADTSPSLVAQQIRQLSPLDVLAVQEVQSSEALYTYTKALAEQHGGRWRYVISERGTNLSRENDLLGIIYITDRLRQLSTTEFHMVRSKDSAGPYGDPYWALRGVLMLRLLHHQSGTEFQIATMHFKCCDKPEVRRHQTKVLAVELRSRNLPTILLGDSNVPINQNGTPLTGANLDTFNNLTTFAGLKMSTQCSEDYNSMLDQVYVPEAIARSTQATILFTEANYCEGDPKGYSDHRPIRATLVGFRDRLDRFEESIASSTATEILDIDEIEENAQRFDRPRDVVAE